MEIEIFVPTGEVRRPVKGECIKDHDDFWLCPRDGHYVAEYPIYRREVIEVPEGAMYIEYALDEELTVHRIDLSRPKVKKWKHTFNNYGITCFTEPITEEQAQRLRDETYLEIKKLPETEIEV